MTTTDPPPLIASADIHRRISDDYLTRADWLITQADPPPREDSPYTPHLARHGDIAALAALATAHASMATALTARHLATPPRTAITANLHRPEDHT